MIRSLDPMDGRRRFRVLGPLAAALAAGNEPFVLIDGLGPAEVFCQDGSIFVAPAPWADGAPQGAVASAARESTP